MPLKQKCSFDITVQKDLQILQTKRIWKNVVMITIVFMLNYSAYIGLYAIQSSLHRDEGMGTTGASVFYITSTITVLFLSPLLVGLLGQKWTIFTSLISFFIWIAANGIGTWGSIITGSVINGLFSGPMWAAQGSYLTELAKMYGDIKSGVTAEQMTSFFFGVFYIQYGLSGFIGDVITSSILIKTTSENYTFPSEEEIQNNCGMNDCPWIEHNITTFDEPADNIVWTMVGISLILSLSAILLTAFGLDSLNTLKEQSDTSKFNKKEIGNALLACFKLIKHRRLWLIMFMDAYLPMAVAFRLADFNGSWVTCALGIWMVGLVSIPGQLIKIPIAPATGYIAKEFGRIIPMLFSIILWFILVMTLSFWNINSEDRWMYFLLSVLYALHASPFDTLAVALHGIAFPDDTIAIYTWNNVFWSGFSAIPFGYSYYICSDTKLYIITGMFIISCSFYFLLEWDMYRSKPKLSHPETSISENTPSKMNASKNNELQENVSVYDNQSYTTF